MPEAVIDRAACRAFAHTARVGQATLAAPAMHTPVAALPLGDERLPVGVEHIHLEPPGDGHATARKGKVIRRTPDDFHQLIIAIEFDRFSKTGLSIHERYRKCPSLSAMEPVD